MKLFINKNTCTHNMNNKKKKKIQENYKTIKKVKFTKNVLSKRYTKKKTKKKLKKANNNA